jgi:threonine synthase
VPFTEHDLDTHEHGLWRYASALPALPDQHRIRLGEAMTPLIESARFGAHLKIDYLLPSGSYKDRGTALMISRLRHLGVREVIEDSSGNAGSSVAVYCAAAGIACEIFVPAGNSPDKLLQISAYGARLNAVDGDRAAVAKAVLTAAETRFYASHNWHPDFHAGVSTLGFEIWEQSGARQPDAVVVPCGHGSLVLGVHRAYLSLLRGSSIRKVPRIFAVQAAAFSSVARAWAADAETAEPVQGSGGTIAEGIATRLPLRGAEVLLALHESGGGALAVSEEDIRAALADLVHSGVYVEPTGAVGLAGLHRLRAEGRLGTSDSVVVVLTGSGLKAGRRISEALGQTREV